MPGFEQRLGRKLDFDPDGARALLAQAGYLDSRGFPPLTFSFQATSEEQPRVAFVRTQWQRHLNIDVALGEGGVFSLFALGRWLGPPSLCLLSGERAPEGCESRVNRVATALLHREHPEREHFSINEILTARPGFGSNIDPASRSTPRCIV